MKSSRFFLLLILLFTGGCVGPGRPPHAFLPPIAEEYHRCEKCGSLNGGIYGKGPLASFEATGAASCWHRWHQISKAEFQKQAKENFADEWSKTSPFLQASAPP